MADLITQIKTALKKVGLDEELADQIKVEKEEDIDAAVNTLKADIEGLKSLSGEDFLNAIEGAGLSEPLKKYLQSETDKRVTEAIKTHDANLQTKVEEDETKVKTEKAQEGMTEDQKTIAKQGEQITALNEKIDKILTKTSKQDVSVAVKLALKEADLDEGFSEFINVNSVEEVGAAVKNLSEKVVAGQQQKIDKKLEEAEVPASGKTPASSTDSDIAEYAKKKSEERGGGGIISEQLEDKKKE